MERTRHQNRISAIRMRPLAVLIAHICSLGALGLTLMANSELSEAAPQGGQVVGGAATIQQNGTRTQILQQSPRAMIDWRSFSVGATESVNFSQPGATAAILNRVVGSDPSAILGRITANGQVFLVNPNGIVFGRESQVNVGSLLATTSNIANADFMAGRLEFRQPGKPGASVINEGRITIAEGGFAGLVAPTVINSGVISARLGKVALAAGDAFVLDLYGDSLVNLLVDRSIMEAITDVHGKPLAARIEHSGTIDAQGGQVQISVDTVRRLVENVINVSGLIRATSFASNNGVISLHGDDSTRVAVSGTLDVSGTNGGRIEASGKDVSIDKGALLDASGQRAGGQVLVGGAWQGKGPLPNAQYTQVAQGATIDVSARDSGDGGTAVVWSDGSTKFAGSIQARGGQNGGNGGKVEVSGRSNLAFAGSVDASAVAGAAGMLLLDPANLTVASTGSTSIPAAGSAGDFTVSAGTVNSTLRGGTSVTLQADNDIVIASQIDGRSASGGSPGAGLTLGAGRDIMISDHIILRDGPLDASAGGRITQAADKFVATGSGKLTLSGKAGINASTLLAGGDVKLESTNGAITVGQGIANIPLTGNSTVPERVASLTVSGKTDVTLNGALVAGNTSIASSAGNVTLNTAAVDSNGPVTIIGGVVTANGAGIGIASKGRVEIDARNGMSVDTVLTPGEVTLGGGAGPVSVSSAINGVSKFSVVSGTDLSLTGVTSGAGGISITGMTGILTSFGTPDGGGSAQSLLLKTSAGVVVRTSGQAGSDSQRLSIEAGSGGIEVAGAKGVFATGLVSPGTVAIDGGSGTVHVDAVAGAPVASVDASSAASGTITIDTTGPVVIGTVVAAAGGVAIGQSQSRLPASIRFSGPVFSQGSVQARSADGIAFDDKAGVKTALPDSVIKLEAGIAGVGNLVTGNSVIESAGGASLEAGGKLTVGSGGIITSGTDTTSASESVPRAGISLSGHGGVELKGSVRAKAGTIGISAAGGDIVQTASVSAANVYADTGNAVIDGGTDALSSVQVSITENSPGFRVVLGNIRGVSKIDVVANGADVVLKGPLGGAGSGYLSGDPATFAVGTYPNASSGGGLPLVGSLSIAARHVEINGLNLNGRADGDGLKVSASGVIVSNQPIGVNLGAVKLLSTGTGALDGVYLGGNVLSRGIDTVASGTVTRQNFPITITGQRFVLFDHSTDTSDTAVLAAGDVAKVIVSNQAAYEVNEGSETLKIFPKGPDPQSVTVSGTFQAVGGPYTGGASVGKAFRINNGTLVGEDGVAVAVGDLKTTGEGKIALKLVTMSLPADESTEIGNKLFNNVIYGNDSAPCNGITCATSGTVKFASYPDVKWTADKPFSPEPQNLFPALVKSGNSVLVNASLGDGLNPTFAAQIKVGFGGPGEIKGSVSGSVVRLGISAAAPGDGATRKVYFSGQVDSIGTGQELEGANFDVNGNLVGGTWVPQPAQFDSSGGMVIAGTTQSNTAYSVGGSNTSFGTVGGGFGPLADGKVANGSNGVSNGSKTFQLAQGPSSVGLPPDPPVVPPVVVAPPVVVVGPPANVPTEGTSTGINLGSGATGNPVLQAVAAYDSSQHESATASGRPQVLELALGSRPAADADLGRNGSLTGAVSNVFVRKYRLAQSMHETVCAPDEIESINPLGDPREGGGRVCSE